MARNSTTPQKHRSTKCHQGNRRGKSKRKGKTAGSRASRFWLGLLKFLGFFVLAGLLLLYWDSARLASLISHAVPVQQLTADTNGIVRIEGIAEGEAAAADEGKLRQRYLLLQKEKFNWHCSKSGCNYMWNEDAVPPVWGNLSIQGVKVESERFKFYSDWLPLDYETVEPDQIAFIHEGGTSRPLLVESPKETAYGYHALMPGERITVIGRAANGHLEPIHLPGEEEDQRMILIGSSVEEMLSSEKETQTGVLIAAGFVSLFLVPVIIGWIWKGFRKIQTVHSK
ncbi:hypothetical protein FHS19_001438 [Paenibacillus rhizosphaerae]|uniref:Uncharacterized protein n=1 Tax=Paenibacillus rhizosphaerae TaxID=297318 RepID=A0A839TJ65_9BACL|nr:hypothetical protein [Paenibacillus rhizosphaerae]MBB3126784.1 hypothetical protein [Paenibacillus rhizosphaerae]